MVARNMTDDEEKAIVLAKRILDCCANSGQSPFVQLQAMVIVTASSAQTMGVSLEAIRSAMHVFLNPRGQDGAAAAANVINLDQRRQQG
jgi:hypothetical protein